MTLLWLGLAWVSGILLGHVADLTVAEWLILSAICFLSLLLFRGQNSFIRVYLALLVLSLGAARYQANRHKPDPQDISWYNDSEGYAAITGVVAKPPDVRDSYIGLQINTETLRFGSPGSSFPVEGRILARASRFNDWSYGDRVLIQGFLQTPPEYEGFDYQDYLARKDVYTIVPYASVKLLEANQGNPILGLIFRVRTHALKTIQAIFPDPEASLLSGILVGVERGIPPDLQEDFNTTGTTHIIAISGFNITIIAAIFMSLFRRILGSRKGMIAAGIGIIFYTILVGGDAPVVRAAIMGSLTLIALRIGRQTEGLVSLAATAILMTLIDPDVLWDVGFQLSFAATLGLMLFTPPLERGLTQIASSFLSTKEASKFTQSVSEFLLYTIAAQIMTFPLTATYFHQLSLTSILANPVILPAQPLLMITGGLATMVGMISIPLGRLMAMIAWPFPAFTIWAVSLFAQTSWGHFRLGHLNSLFVILWYAALCLPILIRYLPTEKWPAFQLPTVRTSTILVILVILSALIHRSISDRPDGKLHLTVLDVGMGDATLIQAPSGRFLLVDGGPSPITLSESLGRQLPLFSRNLDWLVLTGTKEGQLGGLAEVIPRFPPERILLAGPPRTGAYRYFIDQITETGIPLSHAVQGQRFKLSEACTLEVIESNDKGAVMLITYGKFRMLLAPSADPSMLDALRSAAFLRGLSAVLLPDGGSDLVNPPDWLTEIDPRLALISVGAGNTRGLPSDSVLRALEGRTVLRTDLNGTISITTDGDRMWVEVQRTID